jgi:ABC-2 type transport system ATP-binding protein
MIFSIFMPRESPVQGATASGETTRVQAVEITGLRVVRGGAAVLDGLELVVGGGRVTGLLGPSGSGKTTLMRAIVGVQRIAGGTVMVLGHPAGTAELRRRVAYVTQAPAVYADLSVRENLRYFARILHAQRGAVEDAVASVSLGDVADKVVGRLSGGQRARVSLATALLGTPELLVLDEPTVGLDPVLRRELWDLFHALAADGATLLVSSHVMDEAERCDELVLLRDGAVLATGTPAELRARTDAERLDDVFLRLVEAA